MRLVSAVLGFVLRKVGVLLTLLLFLFVGFLLVQALVPSVRDAVADRDRLRQLNEEQMDVESDLTRLRATAGDFQSESMSSLLDRTADQLKDGQEKVANAEMEVAQRLENRDEVCGFVQKLIDRVTPTEECEAAERLAAAADKTLDEFEGGLRNVEDRIAVLQNPELTNQEKLKQLGEPETTPALRQQIDDDESRLDRTAAEQDSLEDAQASGVGWLVNQWAQSWKWLMTLALVALLLPPAIRVVSYFVLMPVLKRVHKPIHLAAGAECPSADLRTSEAQRSLTIHLSVGEVLSARSEHVRPVQGKTRSRILYEWKSPFISFASGLHSLSRVTGGEDGSLVTLATPDDPNSYLMRLDITDHPGLVVHPKHVVGVIGTPELQTRWRWGIASFATWQVRYIMFAGTGSLIVQGCGDVVATNPGGKSTRMNQNLVMGFDSRLAVGVNRTEVFWPYLRSRTPLVDDEFTGDHPLFWQKSTTDGPSNPIAKVFDAFFSAFGKLFGF